MMVNRRLLYLGLQGYDVLTLQNILASLGYYSGPLDGIFGPMTERAVKMLQADNGLIADGIVGPKTYYIIDQLIP